MADSSARVRAAFDSALATHRGKRHPAHVTMDRLGRHVEQWHHLTDGHLRDAIAEVRDWLDRVGEGEF